MNYSRSGLPASRWLAPFLPFLLAFPISLSAQEASPKRQTPARQAPAQPTPPQQPGTAAGPLQPMSPLPTTRDLKVIPLAGDGEMNDLERKVMAPLVVEVLDRNDKPVEGADVVFRFPLNGPSAEFSGGRTSQRVRTNSQGQALAAGWLANNQVGTFDVRIAASYANHLGETTVSMSNVTRIVDDVKKKKANQHQSFWSSKGFKIAAIAGGAALVAGIVLATTGGGGKANPTPAPPTITITPGSPTVGGPR